MTIPQPVQNLLAKFEAAADDELLETILVTLQMFISQIIAEEVSIPLNKRLGLIDELALATKKFIRTQHVLRGAEPDVPDA
jgi:hypothetical protein